MVPMINRETNKMLQIWENTYKNGTKIELASDLSKLTLNVIGFAAFGFNFNSFDENDQRGQMAAKTFASILSYQKIDLFTIISFTFPFLQVHFLFF